VCHRRRIKATGTADAFNRAFSVDMHDVRHDGKRFHRQHRPPVIPILLRDLLVSVEGFTTEPRFHHMHHSIAASTDPAITAAGGTTTPFTTNFGPGTPDLVVPTEQVWGWDYLENYLVAVFGPQFVHALFPVGGGGVSTFWRVPEYQRHTVGIRKTEPNQSILFDDGSGAGPVDLMDLPANFAGRNLPDVSLDGDPFSRVRARRWSMSRPVTTGSTPVHAASRPARASAC